MYKDVNSKLALTNCDVNPLYLETLKGTYTRLSKSFKEETRIVNLISRKKIQKKN